MGNMDFINFDFNKLFLCIDKRMRKIQDMLLKDYGLTHFHTWYLANLYRYGEMNLSSLTSEIGVDKANTTRAVRDLIKKGYIEKLGDSDRKYNIRLSEEGYRVADTFKRHIDNIMKNGFHKFSLSDKKLFFELLNKFSSGVKDATDI